MTKTLRKPVTMLLALCMVFSLAVGACADDITASGGSATSPVNLTTTNDGIGGGGETTPTRMSVTVPTALPMAMSDDGTVVTATDCKITNNSYGAVRVASVSISAAEGWNLTAFGDKASLAGEKVDSNKLGFALSIGGGAQVATSTDEATQSLITAPIAGCYMTGVGDSSPQQRRHRLRRHRDPALQCCRGRECRQRRVRHRVGRCDRVSISPGAAQAAPTLLKEVKP